MHLRCCAGTEQRVGGHRAPPFQALPGSGRAPLVCGCCCPANSQRLLTNRAGGRRLGVPPLAGSYPVRAKLHKRGRSGPIPTRHEPCSRRALLSLLAGPCLARAPHPKCEGAVVLQLLCVCRAAGGRMLSLSLRPPGLARLGPRATCGCLHCLVGARLQLRRHCRSPIDRAVPGSGRAPRVWEQWPFAILWAGQREEGCTTPSRQALPD